MRSIWKGAITFGLVNVPVKVYSATEDHDVSLHQVHDKDGGRIRYQRRCEVCGKVIAYENIDRAYDDGDRTVVLTKDDLSSLPAEKSREIDVVEFVPSEQVDPIMMSKTYYLAPASTSAKSYALLRRTLEETDRTAIVSFTRAPPKSAGTRPAACRSPSRRCSRKSGFRQMSPKCPSLVAKTRPSPYSRIQEIG